jgi:hypothetical protein
LPPFIRLSITYPRLPSGHILDPGSFGCDPGYIKKAAKAAKGGCEKLPPTALAGGWKFQKCRLPPTPLSEKTPPNNPNHNHMIIASLLGDKNIPVYE